MDLSRQKNVWAFNLCTGDVFSNLKWKEYYDPDGAGRETVKAGSRKKKAQTIKKKSPEFTEGSIIGVMIDMDRGILSFFKDGKDLGQAVC